MSTERPSNFSVYSANYDWAISHIQELWEGPDHDQLVQNSLIREALRFLKTEGKDPTQYSGDALLKIGVIVSKHLLEEYQTEVLPLLQKEDHPNIYQANAHQANISLLAALIGDLNYVLSTVREAEFFTEARPRNFPELFEQVNSTCS